MEKLKNIFRKKANDKSKSSPKDSEINAKVTDVTSTIFHNKLTAAGINAGKVLATNNVFRLPLLSESYCKGLALSIEEEFKDLNLVTKQLKPTNLFPIHDTESRWIQFARFKVHSTF
jgi:hypothetical protein